MGHLVRSVVREWEELCGEWGKRDSERGGHIVVQNDQVGD